jgi:hypothetical protein
MWVTKLMENNPWFLGVICLVAGLAVSGYGIFFSRYVFAVIGSVLVFCFMLTLMVLYHTPDTNIARFLLGFGCSILFGVALKKIDRLSLCFMGIVGGLFAGLYVSEIISGLTGWSSFYMLAYSCGVFGVLGLLAAYNCLVCCEINKYTFIWVIAHCKDEYCPAQMHARTFRLIMTSFYGSYLFMRGCALIIGGFPSEKDVFNAWQQELWDTE